MRKKESVFIVLLFAVIVMGFSVNATAQESLIPQWVKKAAGFWINDQISDEEFMAALQYLIDQGILEIPQKPLDTAKTTDSGIGVEMVKCSASADKTQILIRVLITNKEEKTVSIELEFRGIDENGKPLIHETEMIEDIPPGKSILAERVIGMVPNMVGCAGFVNDAWYP